MTDIEPANDEVAQGSWVAVVVAWTLVGVPLGWGIYKTLEKALVLFR
ncbi:MAG TPA: hypothetical protein VIC61_10605 [Gammaproteobacteria bacterium]|jgi:hypothetical protein